MVNISHETSEETTARFEGVIQNADLRILPGSYKSEELPGSLSLHPDALAAIRDGESWSQLVPVDPAGRTSSETFTVWQFHFVDTGDNSGSVGWLANHLKARYGTGVWVICGYNAAQGGVHDYWGCPSVLGDEVVKEVRRLQGRAR